MNASSIQQTVEQLKSKLIQTALDAPEFRDLLKGTVADITAYSKEAPNEASVESYFEIKLYSLLKSLGIELKLSKEVSVDTRRHIGRGRMDSRVGAVVIEYKAPGILETDKEVEKASAQLEDYLRGLFAKRVSFYYGFLTDGNRCREVTLEESGSISQSALVVLGVDEVHRLTKNMLLLEKTALSPENLISDFCSQQTGGLVYSMARSFFAILRKEPKRKTKMLMIEWEQLFKLGHRDKSQQRTIIQRQRALEGLFQANLEGEAQYIALFALQTSYAIIVKLIAYRIISELRFEKPLKSYNDLQKADETVLRIFCAALEDGEIFRELGIVNLLEGDFFSWYSAPEQWSTEVAKHIKKLLEVLARYENATEVFRTKQAIDLFKRLYETIMPQIVRSSLGEFYTPSWLTEHVFNSVCPKGDWRGLDPCCGSGTFVLTMIDNVLKDTAHLPEEGQLQQVLNRVQAIDLNPLAVLTARINYFIRISHLIPERPGHLLIPVYLGDACYVPEKGQVDGIECLKYSVKTVEQQIDVVMPRSLVRDSSHFSELMTAYEKTIKSQDFDGSLNLLVAALSKQESTPAIVKELRRLTQQLIDLEKGKWNGIWARIISNFLITAELGQFDIVIGNPPWIDWKNLPSGYRERIKSLCVKKNLFSGDHRTGGINLNICALIATVSIENWLKDNGKLAFLMPKVIAFQQSYDGYRKFRNGTVPRDFLAFYDWSSAGHPFHPVTERFMTYVIGHKDERRGEVVPVKAYVKKKAAVIAGEAHLPLAMALSRLTEKDQFAGQIMPHITTFTIADSLHDLETFKVVAGQPDYVGREGIEFYPQELLLFRLAAKPPTRPRAGCVYVTNIQVTRPVYSIPPETVELETKYLFPLVRSPEIGRFELNYSGILVPFPYDDNNPKAPLSREQLKNTKLLDYLIKYKEIFDKQTAYYQKIRGPNAGDFYGLARVGPYSFASYYVAFRDSTKWCATVLEPTNTSWGGGKRFVLQNHAASICEDKNGHFITREEAHYICAILNTPIVEKYLEQSSDSRSFKVRPPVNIPKFDSNNEKHKLLSQLSQQAHSNPVESAALRRQMETTYLDLLGTDVQKRQWTRTH